MISVAIVLLMLGGACFLVRALVGPSLADRVIALDGIVITMVAATILNAVRTGTTWFVGLSLVAAFIGFVGATAAARFIERRGG